MDEESILESRIDVQEQKLDHLATQMRDLSQSIYSMRDTLKISIEKMMFSYVRHQGGSKNPEVEANRCTNGEESLQESLLALDRRIKSLLNSNKDQQRSTNLVGSTKLLESTKLMDEGEKTDASRKGADYQGMNRDVMVKPELLIEPKILTQLEGAGLKRSIELGKPNRSISVSKQSPQPNYLSHQLMVAPKLLLLHRLLTPKDCFINYCYEVSDLWNADKLFDESPRLNQPGKTEYTKIYGVWYAEWGLKPRKLPDHMNFCGVYAICRNESLKPVEPPDYNISTYQHNSLMSSVTPLKSSATTLLPVLEFLVSALNSFKYVNYLPKKPAKPPDYNPNSTITEPRCPTNHPCDLIICLQYYQDQNEKPSSIWQLGSQVGFVWVRFEIGYCVFMLGGISLFVEHILEALYKKLVQSIINGVKHGYGMKYVAMVLAIRTEDKGVALAVVNPELYHGLPEAFNSKASVRFIFLLWVGRSSLGSLIMEGIPVYSYKEMIDMVREHRATLVDLHDACEKYVYEPIKSDDVTALIYTSGSTHNSRGVMLTRSYLLRQIWNLWDVVRDRLLSMFPPWHVYECSCGDFILSYGAEQVHTTMKHLKDDLRHYHPQCIIYDPLVLQTLCSRIQKQISIRFAVCKLLALSLIKISMAYMEFKNIYEGKYLSITPKRPSYIAAVLHWLYARVIAVTLFPLQAFAKKVVYSNILTSNGLLKAGISGGGGLPLHIDKFFEVIDPKTQDGYGLTESSLVVAAWRPNFNVLGSLGHPLRHIEIIVEDDEAGEDFPLGSKGIVKARGPQIMRGYCKNYVTTKQALDEHDWSTRGFCVADLSMGVIDGLLSEAFQKWTTFQTHEKRESNAIFFEVKVKRLVNIQGNRNETASQRTHTNIEDGAWGESYKQLNREKVQRWLTQRQQETIQDAASEAQNQFTEIRLEDKPVLQ